MEQRQKLWERAELDELLNGDSRTGFLLRFVLGHEDLHTTIVGTRNPEHLASNIAAAQKGPLPRDVRTETERRIAKLLET